MREMTAKRYKTLDMVYISMCTILIAVCSWISIPTAIPFTLQTFAVLCTVGLLGGKRGTIAVLLYILLGVVGLPVFAGFGSGVGALLGMTGGYIIGFIFTALAYSLITRLFGNKTPIIILAMFVGMLCCYLFGTAWFMYVYTRDTGAVGLTAVLGWCVFPFIIPDLIKTAMAVIIVKRLAPYVNK